MTTAVTGAAAMAYRAVAILEAAMTIATDDHPLTIDRCAAGAAGVGVATARRAVSVAVVGLAGGRGEDGKAGGGNSQEGEDLFHGWGRRFVC